MAQLLSEAKGSDDGGSQSGGLFFLAPPRKHSRWLFRETVSPNIHPVQKSEGICIAFPARAVRVSVKAALAGISRGLASWHSESE